MRLKMALMGDKTGPFSWLPMATSAFTNNAEPSHSSHISHKRPRISSTSSNTCQGFSSRPWEPLFNSLQFPHLLKQPLNRITDSQIQDFSLRVLRSPDSNSTPPYPRENNNKLKTMCPLRVPLFRERIGVDTTKADRAVLEREWGHFGVDMAWNWINKWRNTLFVAWVQQSQRKARGVATMRDPGKP